MRWLWGAYRLASNTHWGGFDVAFMWPWGGFRWLGVALPRRFPGRQTAFRDSRPGQRPDEVVATLGLHGDETVFDLGAGSGYFSFTEKPDLLPYQVFLVFRKGT